ncbi:MAG: hypothetical protein J6N76_04160 [Lachnospiraceae bacterium]|nr:hypothetical protein [Lachnospiraceae bacterium]
MKKKILATLIAATMAIASFTACGGGSAASDASSAVTGDVSTLGLTAEFDPNPEYDVYTLVDYTIEDIGAEFVATVSKMADGSKYEIHCNFYGDEQLAVVENGAVTEDKTGFMEGDSPKIVEAAEAQGVWSATK